MGQSMAEHSGLNGKGTGVCVTKALAVHVLTLLAACSISQGVLQAWGSHHATNLHFL